MFSVNFTEKQMKFLQDLLDVALKTGGLNALNQVVDLFNTLNNAKQLNDQPVQRPPVPPPQQD